MFQTPGKQLLSCKVGEGKGTFLGGERLEESEGTRCAQENIRAGVLERCVSMDKGRKMTITMFLPLDFRVSIGRSTARNECGPGKDHRRRHLIDQVSVCFYF